MKSELHVAASAFFKPDKMISETTLLLFALFIITIVIVISLYWKQKIKNQFLKKEIKLIKKIYFYQSLIENRQFILNLYDFQLFNLAEALAKESPKNS